MNTLLLTSTMQRAVEQFSPQNPPSVTMYVCGVTPYDDAHIGHGRCYVTFDVLYRLLIAQGYSVTYCRNVTDIEDKLLNKSQAQHGTPYRYQEIATHYLQRFQEDVMRLGCCVPQVEPRVTDHIPEIITAVQGLIEKGHAYESSGSVYYRVASYPSYGRLSHQNIDDLRVGARVECNKEKEDQLDFALWKSEPEGTFWHSPWGWGRPGWHIECSVLAHHYLGTTLDIHGGGMDLMFPHHENERAQSEALYGAPFVRCWMHNAFVRVQQEKMSKSLGNFITLRQAFERCEPEVLRYYYLIHHYTKPLDFSWEDIAGARKSYQKLVAICGENADTSQVQEMVRLEDLTKSVSPARKEIIGRIIAMLLDNVNIQGACGIIFEHADQIRTDVQLQRVVRAIVCGILGLSLRQLAEKQVEITPAIQKLLDERAEARRNKNWQRADELRAQLAAMKVVVKDDKL